MTLAETLAPHRVRAHPLLFPLLAAAAGSLVVALLAQVAVPLPFTPVPLTGQTLGVLLVGAALGARAGALSLLLYVALGALGAPVYASGAAGAARLLSATGGYLAGFVAAAALVGRLAERGWDRGPGRALAALVAGEAVVFAAGVTGLAVALELPAGRALELGLLPFLPGEALKVLLAAGLLPGAWRLLGGRAPRR